MKDLGKPRTSWQIADWKPDMLGRDAALADERTLRDSKTGIIDLSRISRSHLETRPYRWAAIDRLFGAADATALASTFPRDHFKRVADHAGEKKHEYQVRALVRASARFTSGEKQLSSAWKALALDFLSPGYRKAMSALTGLDLRDAELEVNVFHYPPGGVHGAHTDHPDKIVTHVLYFNESWNDEDGGCLQILKSSDPQDVAARISPLVGNSAVLVRSRDSWHCVSQVAQTCRLSRRSLTATFYRSGYASTVWPRWDRAVLGRIAGRWQRLRNRLSGRREARN